MARLSVELQRYFLNDDSADAAGLDDGAALDKDVTLNEILEIAGERTFGFLFVLLALPSALPVPAPGYSTPFGIVLFLLAAQLIVGREQPWLPEKFRKRGFKRKTVQGFISKGLPWLQRIETVSKPRLTSVCTSTLGRTVMGCAIALMACSMTLPLPLTNTVPAMGIFITGFGLLDDDGAISLLGLAVGTLGLALTSTLLYLIFFVFDNIDLAAEAIKNWIKTALPGS